MLLIGIDEAGYGPLLGPFCHGYCALRWPDSTHAGEPDLWRALTPAFSRHPARNGSTAIDDSKRVHAAPNGLELLQRGVGAFLPPKPETWFTALLPTDDLRDLERDAWGRGPDPARPAHRSCAITCVRERGGTVLRAGARALSARTFNGLLAETGNKAEINLRRIGLLLQECAALAQPGEAVFAAIDRLGGRKFYADFLSAQFPGAMVWIELESAGESRYRLEFPDTTRTTIRVTFRVGGEQHSLPVALASMAAKLARELCMDRFNAYFATHQPDLAPTAGYTTDAHRYLKATRALRDRLCITDEMLVRQK